jgi:hypothetical protein
LIRVAFGEIMPDPFPEISTRLIRSVLVIWVGGEDEQEPENWV